MSEGVIIVAISTVMVLLLSCLVLAARRWLAPVGSAEITLNGRQRMTVARGDKLLWALAANDVLLPAACGGRGSCGQCRVTVVSGGGEILPTERTLIKRRDAAAGVRLACLLTVRRDLAIRVPDSLLAVRRFTCAVRSNTNVTTYLKELVLELPDGLDLPFEAGDYVVLEAPPGRSRFADFDIPETYREAWRQSGLFDLEAERRVREVRAYSIASPPLEKGVLRLVVRIATPPAGAPAGTPPGCVSSFIFGLRPGDTVALSGPFGEFHARDTDAEMILIGGGAGIAPLRAILLDQLIGKRSQRRISLWYGARDRSEICFAGEFQALADRHDNFTWHAALSNSDADADWSGPRGFIHAVVRDEYLGKHPAPEDAEYYLCGPPLMSSAVVAMLEDLGVEADSILFDDFGT
jgi:Na+-transporting NADH:ubiquinone oxidoreductase subunit F